MVTLPVHRERIGDKKTQVDKIGEDFASMRGKHLDALSEIEELAHAKAPLAIAYDVGRAQPPFFLEFTYTEAIGLLYIAPASSEIAARVIAHAVSQPSDNRFDTASQVALRDKYNLPVTGRASHKRVAFIPGANIFQVCVSKEAVDREMHNHPETVIKPHPMSHPALLRDLSSCYGASRVLEPQSSGWEALLGAEEVLTTTSSEMGLFGVLMGKRIRNITNAGFEARGAYGPFYRVLWDLSPDAAAERLRHIINSPYSGLFHPNDPNVSEKMDAFFELAMTLREPFRPLVREYDYRDYAALIAGNLRRNEHAESTSGRQGNPALPAVRDTSPRTHQS